MKKLIAAVICLLSLLGCYDFNLAPSLTEEERQWWLESMGKVEMGMTYSEVREAMGPPAGISPSEHRADISNPRKNAVAGYEWRYYFGKANMTVHFLDGVVVDAW